MDLAQQERFFLEVVINGVPFEVDGGKDGAVGLKTYERTVFFGFSNDFEGHGKLSTVFKADMVDFAKAENLNVNPLGQGIGDGCANAVHPCGSHIVFGRKLTAGVKRGINELNRGVTLYKAYGGKDNEGKIEVVTILQKNEYQLLLEYIHKTDDRAFVTVTSIGEVLGKWNVHRRKKIEIQ